MAEEVRHIGEEKSGERRGRGRTGRCGDDAVSGPAETDSGEAVTMVVGGGWLGRGRERRGRAQRGRVSRGALEQGEGVAMRGAAGALCLCGKKGFAKSTGAG